MRVLIFGAGAIGSLLGHRLAYAGHDVTLVSRPEYARAVRERGLIFEGVHGARKYTEAHTATHYGQALYPTVVEKIADLPATQRCWDLILLTVKVYDAQEAAQALAPYISAKAPLLIVQNGVGGEELTQAVLKQAAIISGVLTLSVSVLAPGYIRLETTRGGLNLSPTKEGIAVDEWAKLFSMAGLKTATYPDYRAMKWSKLLLNIQANAIPAILDMAPGDVFANPTLFAIERAAFQEALAVMRAMQLAVVGFPGYPVPLLAWAMQTLPAFLLRPLLMHLVATGRGDKKPSLHMDLAGGRQRSEVLYLNGAVATYARGLGMDAPVNKALCDTLMGIAAGNVPWYEFRGQPQRLIAKMQGTGFKQPAS